MLNVREITWLEQFKQQMKQFEPLGKQRFSDLNSPPGGPDSSAAFGFASHYRWTQILRGQYGII